MTTTCPEDGSFTIVDFEYNSSTEPEHECFYAVAGSSSSTGGSFEFSPAYVWNGESTTVGPYVYRDEDIAGSVSTWQHLAKTCTYVHGVLVVCVEHTYSVSHYHRLLHASLPIRCLAGSPGCSKIPKLETPLPVS